MSEARRFLRYVIPGLVFLIEVALYLWLSDYSLCETQKSFTNFIKNQSKDIAFPITLFVASGGIGFLLGILYHTLYWIEEIPNIFLPRVNHTQLIESAINGGWIEVYKYKNRNLSLVNTLNRSDAWCSVTAFCHEHLQEFNKLGSANTRTDSLTDIMHGLGATYIGSIIAVVIGDYILAHMGIFINGIYT